MDRPDEDDDELDLPPLPPLGTEEEEVGVEGLGDDDADDDEREESVGLDDSEGIDDFDPLEMLNLDESSALGDTEAAGDLVGDDDLDETGEEYGWTDDSAAPALSEWGEEDPLVGELEELGADDGGALGVEDEPVVGVDDETALPPLETQEDDEEELASDLDLQGDAEIDLGELSFEEEARLMGAALPSADAASAWTRLTEHPAHALCVSEGGFWAVGEDLLHGTPDGVRVVAARGLEAEDLVSVAALDTKRVVVGTRLGGVFLSRDGGESFEPINGWRSGGEPTVPCHVLSDRRTRLWMWAGGALYRSDDLGARWAGPLLSAPVVAATTDGEAVVVLCGSAGQLSLRRSADGGRGWTSRDVPSLRPLASSELVFHVAAHGSAVAVISSGSADGPMVQDGDEAWSPVPGLCGVEAIAWWGSGSLCGALHVASRDRGVVLEQRRYAGEPHTVLDLADVRSPRQDPEGDRRVHALVAAVDGALLVATGVGVFRLTHDR